MINVSGLTKYYGSLLAIEDVTFEVATGEVVGFLGPNGAGKTTVMRILTGYMPASRGTASVAGFDVHEAPLEVKQRVGYMPENVPLYDEMTVAAFLRYVAEVKGVARSARNTEAGRVMERCGLAHMARRVVRNLSRGYRQRVGLAQALVGNPPVLIFDEPTVGLDPSQIIEIRNLIRGLAGDHTVLLSSHILPEVAATCSRVLIVHRGRIAAQDTVAALSGGTRRLLEFECAGPTAQIRELVTAIFGVGEVVSAGAGRYSAELDGDEDPREQVAAALVNAGLGLRALTLRRRTLEEVFVDITSRDADPATVNRHAVPELDVMGTTAEHPAHDPGEPS
jgi:ABC-2 type transport system ATP-binding protein